MTAPTQPQSQGLSPGQIAALLALVEAQAAVRGQLTQTAIAAAVAAFSAITDWWDPKQTSRAVAAALKVVQPSQRQAARITDAYLARAASIITGRRVSPAGVVGITELRRQIPVKVAQDLVAGRSTPGFLILGELDPDQQRIVTVDAVDDPVGMAVPDPGETAAQRLARRRAAVDTTAPEGETPLQRVRRLRAEAAAQAVDPGQPYGRVADGYRYSVVARGETEDQARQRALVRIESVAQTDVTLAVREQVRKTLGKIPNVKGYRRILRPELSESGPCGLCTVAAFRVYRVEDLQPIHSACCCEVLPIIGGLDPGLTLNDDDLKLIYRAAGSTGGGKRQGGALKKIRVALAEHGELGPVLVDADQNFRGPRQVAATKVPDKGTRLRAQLSSLDDSYGRLVRRREAGENVDRPLRWQEKRIAELRRQLVGVA